MSNDMGEIRMVDGWEHTEIPKDTLKYILYVLDILVMVIWFALLFETFIMLHSKMKMSMLILV